MPIAVKAKIQLCLLNRVLLNFAHACSDIGKNGVYSHFVLSGSSF
jgi:hypothetical protein